MSQYIANQTTQASQIADPKQATEMLKDMAYVLQLTARIKADLRMRPSPAPRPALVEA